MEIEKLHAAATYYDSIGAWYMAQIIRGWISSELKAQKEHAERVEREMIFERMRRAA